MSEESGGAGSAPPRQSALLEARKGDLDKNRSQADDELPVVARMVVEIRSDGSRTVARGAIEDVQQGHRVAVEARGESPLALALALAKSITSLPRLSARAAVRGLLGRRSGK